MNLNEMTTKQLTELHNSFAAFMPGLKMITVKTYNNKQAYIDRITQFQALTPQTMATMLGNNTTAYDVRMKLRSAIAEGILPAQKNKRWTLTMSDFLKVFKEENNEGQVAPAA